jgi:hypothetical protein
MRNVGCWDTWEGGGCRNCEYGLKCVRRINWEWGKWLNGWKNWKWFVTLTISDKSRKVPVKYLKRVSNNWAKKMWSDFVSETTPSVGVSEMQMELSENMAGGSHYNYAGVIELQKCREMPHIHALVDCVDIKIDRSSWERDYGFIDMRPYSDKSASFYIGKYAGRGEDVLVGNTREVRKCR